MKIPHSQAVARALRDVRAATKNALNGLNRVAGQRMAKGDYAGAEALAAKGKEMRQFQQQAEELLHTWRELTGRGPKSERTSEGETTPLWGYYQPILRAIVAAGGECERADLEAAFEALSDGFLQPGDRQLMAGGRERWTVMIRRARKALRAEGWIEDVVEKTWRITEAGRQAAEQMVTAPRK